ncbi:hypothetical protein STANM309S_03860 [Streptomyces tanashiensis]
MPRRVAAPFFGPGRGWGRGEAAVVGTGGDPEGSGGDARVRVEGGGPAAEHLAAETRAAEDFAAETRAAEHLAPETRAAEDFGRGSAGRAARPRAVA